jgi:hypothetical protein
MRILFVSDVPAADPGEDRRRMLLAERERPG